MYYNVIRMRSSFDSVQILRFYNFIMFYLKEKSDFINS